MNCFVTSNPAIIAALIAGVISIIGVVLGYVIQYNFMGRKLEQLKSELTMKNKWDEIRLIKLREEQGVVYRKVYKKLVLLFALAKGVSQVRFPKSDELQSKIEKFKNASEAFSAVYETKKIWLNNDLCNLIENIKLKIDEAIRDIEAFQEANTPQKDLLLDKAISDAWEKLTGEIKTIKLEIEGKFRLTMHV